MAIQQAIQVRTRGEQRNGMRQTAILTEHQVLVMFDEARSVCSVLGGFKICALGRSIASTISSNLLRCNWESAVSTHSASASDLVLEFDLTRHGSGKVADTEQTRTHFTCGIDSIRATGKQIFNTGWINSEKGAN